MLEWHSLGAFSLFEKGASAHLIDTQIRGQKSAAFYRVQFLGDPLDPMQGAFGYFPPEALPDWKTKNWYASVFFQMEEPNLYSMVADTFEMTDLTSPGDHIFATSGNIPAPEFVTNVIENKATKYLNFDKYNTGFTVTSTIGMSIVEGLRLMSANDAPDRDPISYLLEGSLDGQVFEIISKGPLPGFPNRFYWNTVSFDNDKAFATYRLTFPEIGGSTCCMQIGEVEFLGTAGVSIQVVRKKQISDTQVYRFTYMVNRSTMTVRYEHHAGQTVKTTKRFTSFPSIAEGSIEEETTEILPSGFWNELERDMSPEAF